MHANAGASALSAHFSNPSQRLQRYIADIRKGFSIIIAAGARALSAPAHEREEPASLMHTCDAVGGDQCQTPLPRRLSKA